MKQIQIFSLIVILSACTAPTSDEKASRPAEWIGEWKAEWETPSDAPSYAGMEDMEFYMDGSFIFTADSLTVQNNGYPGCIFAVDTLKHTQLWSVSSDTLQTYNEPESPGMTYKVTALGEDKIQLQLMEDIFVTLTK
ncbi:MAG: hypothetical protein AAF616_05700 [Bacteroidota bacterium]